MVRTEVYYDKERKYWVVEIFFPDGYFERLCLPNRWQVQVFLDVVDFLQKKIEEVK